MKKYIFLCEGYPLGWLQFDEERGIGEFTYSYNSYTAQSVKVKPSLVVTLLEEVRADAADLKTVGQFYEYVKHNFGKFYFEPLENYK